MAKKDKESLLNRIKAGTRVDGVDGWICFPDKSQLKTFFLSVPFPVVYQCLEKNEVSVVTVSN